MLALGYIDYPSCDSAMSRTVSGYIWPFWDMLGMTPAVKESGDEDIKYRCGSGAENPGTLLVVALTITNT